MGGVGESPPKNYSMKTEEENIRATKKKKEMKKVSTGAGSGIKH